MQLAQASALLFPVLLLCLPQLGQAQPAVASPSPQASPSASGVIDLTFVPPSIKSAPLAQQPGCESAAPTLQAGLDCLVEGTMRYNSSLLYTFTVAPNTSTVEPFSFLATLRTVDSSATL